MRCQPLVRFYHHNVRDTNAASGASRCVDIGAAAAIRASMRQPTSSAGFQSQPLLAALSKSSVLPFLAAIMHQA